MRRIKSRNVAKSAQRGERGCFRMTDRKNEKSQSEKFLLLLSEGKGYIYTLFCVVFCGILLSRYSRITRPPTTKRQKSMSHKDTLIIPLG